MKDPLICVITHGWRLCMWVCEREWRIGCFVEILLCEKCFLYIDASCAWQTWRIAQMRCSCIKVRLRCIWNQQLPVFILHIWWGRLQPVSDDVSLVTRLLLYLDLTSEQRLYFWACPSISTVRMRDDTKCDISKIKVTFYTSNVLKYY